VQVSGSFHKTSHTLTTRDFLGISTTDSGQKYFWLNLSINHRPILKTDVDYFNVSYKVKQSVLVEDRNDGRLIVDFQDSVAAGVEVTATYKTSAVGEGFKYVFRKGDSDQDPVFMDEGDNGFRNAYLVGLQLDQGTARRYSTASDVDDLIIGLESGPEGYYDLKAKSGEFRFAHREIQIRIKETAADDAPGNNNDPATGWIQVLDPNTGRTWFQIYGKSRSTVPWFFSARSGASSTARSPSTRGARPRSASSPRRSGCRRARLFSTRRRGSRNRASGSGRGTRSGSPAT
jgi:hypothetical protein